MIFAALVILWVMIRWDDTRLAETLVLGAFGLIGSAVAFYSGSAAYQDVRLWRRTGGYNDPSIASHDSIEVGEHDGHRSY